MSFKDAVYYSNSDPTPSTDFIRVFWYNEDTEDLWIWSPSEGHYVVYRPSAVIPNLPVATTTVEGIVTLATNSEIDAGTVNKVVTVPGLKHAVDAIIDGAPANLNTLDKLAAAIADNPNFATAMTQALALKAFSDGSNITSPGVGATGTEIATPQYTQQVILDTAVNNTAVDDARTTLAVTGVTNTAGSQKFLTLPTLDRFVALREHIFSGLSGGSSESLDIDNDITLLDGTAGIPTLLVGNPALFKRKTYRIVCVNVVHQPVIQFDPAYPMVDGSLSISPGLGQTIELIPTSLGMWARL